MRRIAVLAESGTLVLPEHLDLEITQFAAIRRAELTNRGGLQNEIVVRLDQPIPTAVEHLEKAMIVHALGVANGVVERAAIALGLSRKGLYLKRQKYQITSASDVVETEAAGVE
jgi:DNA-binding NtrC family response regulator